MSNTKAVGVAYADPALDLAAFTAYTVATVPAVSPAGQLIYVSNGAAGSPVMAFSDGSNWKRVDTLATISAS